MSSSSLADALASGASVVTPNNRLAREAVLRFDAAQRARGARTWTPARAMPWSAWLETLWRAAVGAGANVPALLDPAACREAWYRIVTQHSPSLVNARGAARHALEAWTVFHAWRAPVESLGAIAKHGDEDARCFALWAEAYQAQLDALGAIDRAQLPDRLACADGWTGPLGHVVLYGFLSSTPQQQRLIDALRAAGVAIETLAVASGLATRRCRTVCATPSLELTEAFAFARSSVIANPAATVAIVVADLARRRDEVVAIADEALCPGQLLALESDASRPYDVSLGQALGSVPIVVSALDLIALTGGNVEAATIAATALRAPFLPDAALRWQQRAAIEGRWRAEGRRSVGWNDVLAALARHDAALHARFDAIAHRPRGAQLPREWARAWSETLVALGWPGTATLSSAQWQAREAWSAALARFASVGAVTGALSAAEALESLRALLADTPWAAEAGPAQIRVLGVLEAAGLAFDHAWLAGFDAQRWPPAAATNPFLPLAWQRARGVTDANPEASLSHARQLTMQLSSLAPDVVVSHAEQIDDAPATLSPLFADWPRHEPSDAAFMRWSAAMPAVELERVVDATGPPLAANVALRGGAGLFESQSTCPFQAFARHRLRSDAWAEVAEGLSPRERGIVLHAVMKSFWDGVGDQATLVALGARELAAHVAAAVAAGKTRLDAARWRALPPAIAAAESRRLAALLASWIDEVERVRPPFRVRSHELPIEFAIEGIPMRLRVDRIDELDAGGIAIIDYKSGAVTRPVRWLAPRPAGVQLGVYAHGLDALDSGDIRVLAYAQLKAGEIGTTGLMASEGLFPGLEVPGSGRSRVPAASFGDARAQLDVSVVLLARELRTGVASVAPRDRSDCGYCEQKPLCRIRRLDDTVVANDGARLE